jgi:hypothetical protein
MSLSQTPTPQSEPTVRSDTVRRVSAYIAAAFFGGLVGLTLVLWLARSFGPDALPVVTESALQEARERWRSAAPINYQLDVKLTGRESATFSVKVRNGVVLEATRNGEPLKQERTWGTWTGPGMFETIERDLELAARSKDGKVDPGSSRLLIQGEFDSRWGFPRRYRRMELHRYAANQEVTWEVTRFELTDL